MTYTTEFTEHGYIIAHYIVYMERTLTFEFVPCGKQEYPSILM